MREHPLVMDYEKMCISGPPPPAITWAVYQRDIDRVRVGFVKNNYTTITTEVSDTEFKGSCNVPFVSNKVIYLQNIPHVWVVLLHGDLNSLNHFLSCI